jgi:dienelactone hydrolase
VTTVDQYDGKVFEGYDEGLAHAEAIGYPALMRRAIDGVAGLADGFIAIGFSNGAGMAEYVATQRPVSRVVLVSGALPLDMLGADRWPAGVPVQTHATRQDPFRRQEWIDAFVSAVEVAGAPIEAFAYAGSGHLFTDPSLPSEHDPQATELLWARVLAYCEGP